MCTSQLRWKTKCCSCDGTNEQDLDAFVVHVKSFSVFVFFFIPCGFSNLEALLFRC